MASAQSRVTQQMHVQMGPSGAQESGPDKVPPDQLTPPCANGFWQAVPATSNLCGES